MAFQYMKADALDSLLTQINSAVSQSESSATVAVDAKNDSETFATISDNKSKQNIRFNKTIDDIADLPTSSELDTIASNEGVPKDGYGYLLISGSVYTGYVWSELQSDWVTFQLQGEVTNILDILTSEATDKAASANIVRVLDEKKSDITTPIENVPTGSNYSTVATDADKIKNRTDTGDFIVTKDEIASGRAIAFMKTTASTVNVTFATDVDAIPSSLTSGFAIPEQDQIIWLFQVRPNEWKVLGSSSHDQNTDTKLDEGGANEVTAIELRNHVDSTSDAHTQNTDTKLDEGGANETSASELRSHLDSTDDPHGTKDLGLGTNGSATNLDSATTEDVIRSTASFTGTILTSLSKPISLVQDGASNTITVSAGAGVTLVGSTLSTTNDKDSLGILPIGNDTFLIFYRETPAND